MGNELPAAQITLYNAIAAKIRVIMQNGVSDIPPQITPEIDMLPNWSRLTSDQIDSVVNLLNYAVYSTLKEMGGYTGDVAVGGTTFHFTCGILTSVT